MNYSGIIQSPRKRVLAIILSAALLVCLSVPGNLFAQANDTDLKPNAKDRQVSLAIANLMRSRHITRKPIDDKISVRGLNQFLDNLDPGKVYFMKSDIEKFEQQKNELDDMLKSGDLSFAFTIFKTFLERIDQRVAKTTELIDTDFDFSKDEEIVTDPDLVNYAKNETEANERWRKRIKFNFLVERSKKENEEKSAQERDKDIRDTLKRRYKFFAKRMHQFDNEEISEMYLTAITSSYDPHTSYFSQSTLENFDIVMRLSLEGIGASLQSEDGLTVVKRIVPGGAAAKDGRLKVEDRIVGVAQGDDGEVTDVRDMKLDDVVKQIRGKAGTVVRLEVMGNNSTKVKTIAITREKIELKDSEAQGEVFEIGSKPDGGAYKVGVVELPSFYADMSAAQRGIADYKSCTKDVKKILEKFRKQKVDSLVLDLRMNGGGSLGEAIDLTGLFIDRGPVVQIKNSLGQVQTYSDTARGVAWDGPLVVLTSKFSASASEILAGAVKDYERGIVIGDDTTHGKGTVQGLVNVAQVLTGLPAGRASNKLGALKITQSQFYRPNGDSTQKRGVPSDITLPSISNHMDISEADMDFALDFDKIDSAEYPRLNMVDANILASLNSKIKKRITVSKEFKDLSDDILTYKTQKSKKTATLNEVKFKAEREKLDADKVEEDIVDENENKKIKRDFYLNEVMDIAVDYVELLKKKNKLTIN